MFGVSCKLVILHHSCCIFLVWTAFVALSFLDMYPTKIIGTVVLLHFSNYREYKYSWGRSWFVKIEVHTIAPHSVCSSFVLMTAITCCMSVMTRYCVCRLYNTGYTGYNYSSQHIKHYLSVVTVVLIWTVCFSFLK